MLYEDSILEKELRPKDSTSKSQATANMINSERETATTLWRARTNKRRYQANGEISGPATVEYRSLWGLWRWAHVIVLVSSPPTPGLTPRWSFTIFLLKDTPWALPPCRNWQAIWNSYPSPPVHLSVCLIFCSLHYMLLGLRVPQWIKMI